MVRQKLFEDRNVCVLPARHLYAKRLTLERFATLPHFQLSPRRLNEDFVDAALKKHQLTRTVVARVPHFTAAPQLVLAAKGIAVVPERTPGVLWACAWWKRRCRCRASAWPRPSPRHRGMTPRTSGSGVS